MAIPRWLSGRTATALLVGIALGVIGLVAAEQVDHYTSTDAFCSTSCHSMQTHVANDPSYRDSAHRTGRHGVLATCSDCHISKAGILPATWDHVAGGIKDIYYELTVDFQDPENWNARRAKRAYAVRDRMLADDSANCRVCHVADAIAPERKRGQKQHAEAKDKGVTCISCHYNLVHQEVEPRESFLEQAERGR